MKKLIAFLCGLLLIPAVCFAQCDTSIDGHEVCDFEITDFYGLTSAPAVSSAGTARQYFDTGEGKWKCSEDGGAYVDCIGSGGTALTTTTDTTDFDGALGSGDTDVQTALETLDNAIVTGGHDPVTLAGQDYLTLSTQEITAGLINGDNINWSTVDELVQSGNINWTSLEEVIQAGAINWTGIDEDVITSINWDSYLGTGEEVNWDEMPIIQTGGINWTSVVNEEIASAGINWTSVEVAAPITESMISDLGSFLDSPVQRGEINWTLIEDVQSAGINWNSVDVASPITESMINDLGSYLDAPVQRGEINWTLIQDIQSAGINWTNVQWSDLVNYPDPCGVGGFVTGLGDTLSCDTPAGGGDMSTGTYDTDTNNIVDEAEAVNSSGINWDILIDSANVNWTSLDEVIHSAAINWSNIEVLTPITESMISDLGAYLESPIQRGDINWTLIEDVQSAGINWSDVEVVQAITSSMISDYSAGGINDIVEDTTPQLGGNLDVNGKQIVSVSNGNIPIIPNGSGKVGIATTTPSQTLSIVGSVGIGTTAAGAGASAAGNLLVDRFVGIGTTAPQTLLELQSDSNNLIEGLGSITVFNSPRNRFTYYDDASPDAKWAIGSGWNSAIGFAIYGKASGNFTEANQLMVMQTDGNVGIGTTAPAYDLEVSGNIYASGDITCGGSCGSGSGDSVTVNTSTAIDTTANLADGGIKWSVTDGGAGGPDDILGTINFGTAFPGSPTTGDAFIVTDDSAAGACDSNAGAAESLCYWDGDSWESVGDGNSGGATAWDDVGDPDAEGTIAFGSFEQTITTTLDDATAGTEAALTIENTDAALTNDTSLLDLIHADDEEDNAIFWRAMDAGGTEVVAQLGPVHDGGKYLALYNEDTGVTEDTVMYYADFTGDADDDNNIFFQGTTGGSTVLAELRMWADSGTEANNQMLLLYNKDSAGPTNDSIGIEIQYDVTGDVNIVPIRVREDVDGTPATTFQVGSNRTMILGGIPYTLPADDGDAGEQLQTNGSGALTWEAAGAGGGATTALDNLASVAINTSLLSDTADTDDLGSTAKEWANIYVGDAGKIYLGLGQDVSLNRSAANVLTITASGGVVVPNDSIGADEIDSTTGAYDFGGVTSLEIPNGDPTVDAAGEIAIDTTSDQLIYYGAAKRVIAYNWTECRTIEDPVEADDNVPFWFHKNAVTITDVYCEVDGGTSIVLTLSDGTNELEAITCDGDGAEDDGSIANGTFTARERIEADLSSPSGTNTWLVVCVTFETTAD